MTGISSALLGHMMSLAGVIYRRRFLSRAQHAAALNQAQLLFYLKSNANTAFGRLHGFSSLRTPQDYRQALPLATYDDFRPFIERIAAGESQVLTADPVTSLSVTSGTTGRNKLLPLTPLARKQNALAGMLMIPAAVSRLVPWTRRGGRGTLLFSASLPGRSSGGLPIGASTSGGMKGMARMSPYLWTTPPQALEAPRAQDQLYLHALFALLEADLLWIGAPFVTGVLEFFRLLLERQEELVTDLCQGTLSQRLELPQALRQHLLPALSKANQRGKQVEAALGKGPQGLARRLWPGLRYTLGVTTGSYAVYLPILEPYLGGIPVYSPVYSSSEGLIGMNPWLEGRDYLPPPEANFLELIPVAHLDDAQPPTLLMHELEVGQEYELVLTTATGLCRYRLGDVVRVEGYVGQLPRLAFRYRRGQLLTLVGEKTSEASATQAILDALGPAGGRWADFTTQGLTEAAPPRYRFYLEPVGEAWSHIHEEAQRLETALRATSPRYAGARDAGRLAPLELALLTPGTFLALKQLLIARGASPAQVKVPRVVVSDDISQLLSQRIHVLGEARP